MGSGDPARKRNDYYPWWLDKLADDATGEGAFMQGTAQGADAVRSLVTYARTLYEYQEFNHFGDYGDERFIEDYTTQIHGEPTGVIVTVTRNAAGDAQHIVVNHRPRSSVLLLTGVCGEVHRHIPGERLCRRRARRQGEPGRDLPRQCQRDHGLLPAVAGRPRRRRHARGGGDERHRPGRRDRPVDRGVRAHVV